MLADNAAVVIVRFWGTLTFGSVTLTAAAGDEEGLSDIYVAKNGPGGAWP